jgi:hypothetical protein
MNPEPFHQLSPAQAERLYVLIEECGEVIQAAGKVLRHGYESRNPLDDFSPTSQAQLTIELGHLRYITGLLSLKGDIDDDLRVEAAGQKAISIQKWLHHQNEESGR